MIRIQRDLERTPGPRLGDNLVFPGVRPLDCLGSYLMLARRQRHVLLLPRFETHFALPVHKELGRPIDLNLKPTRRGRLRLPGLFGRGFLIRIHHSVRGLFVPGANGLFCLLHLVGVGRGGRHLGRLRRLLVFLRFVFCFARVVGPHRLVVLLVGVVGHLRPARLGRAARRLGGPFFLEVDLKRGRFVFRRRYDALPHQRVERHPSAVLHVLGPRRRHRGVAAVGLIGAYRPHTMGARLHGDGVRLVRGKLRRKGAVHVQAAGMGGGHLQLGRRCRVGRDRLRRCGLSNPTRLCVIGGGGQEAREFLDRLRPVFRTNREAVEYSFVRGLR